MIDPFGLREEPEAEKPAREPNASDAPPSAVSRKRVWAVLLLLDTIFLIVFGGTIVRIVLLKGGPEKLLEQWFGTEPPPPIAPRKQIGRIRHGAPSPAAAPSIPVSTSTVAASAVSPSKSEADTAKAPPASAGQETESAPQELKKAKPVEFTCISEKAKEVYLKGSFLVHSKNGTKKMKKGDNGVWHLTVSLFPGTYKYQCIVNGKKYPFKPKEVE